MPVKYIAPVKKTTRLSLICDGEPHRLDVGLYTPTLDTLLLAAPYLNMDDAVMKGDPDGRIQVFMRRAAWEGQPVDDTFYTGFWMHRPGYSHKDDRVHMEWAEKGRPLSWYYETAGLKTATIGTRYVKYALIT